MKSNAPAKLKWHTADMLSERGLPSWMRGWLVLLQSQQQQLALMKSDPQRHAPQGQESHPSAYTQASTAIYIQNIQPHSATATVPSSGTQPTYTRQDVEKKVMQRLRDLGHKEITRTQLEEAVDDAMRSLEAETSAREERATSVPAMMNQPCPRVDA
jgi:hypothetical protein